jgi:hypothetical protein
MDGLKPKSLIGITTKDEMMDEKMCAVSDVLFT